MHNLAVSNIAWTGNNHTVLSKIREHGITGVEVALGKIASWEELTKDKVKDYRSMCEDYGLTIPSFQAFLFGKPDLQLLGDQANFDQLLHHLEHVADMAYAAGARVLVFGAPSNRRLCGYTATEALRLAEERLFKMAAVAHERNATIGLEAVPRVYGEELITSYLLSMGLVERVNHPGLSFHLDSGATFMNNDDVSEAVVKFSDRVCHFHISQPNLENFSKPASYHPSAAEALRTTNYNRWSCIEMRESDDSLASIIEACDYVNQVYAKGHAW